MVYVENAKKWWTRLPKVYPLFFLFFTLLYAPYVVRGGLEYDDWNVVRLGKACPGIAQSFKCYWPSYADRPLAGLYYSLTTNIFHTWAPGYMLLNLAMFAATLLVLFHIFKRRFGMNFATAFLFVAAVPVLSSTIIFSPAMQSIGTLTFLLWAVALHFLDKHVETKQDKQLWISFGILFVSLLLYESSLPLFGLSALWLFILKPQKQTLKYWLGYAKKYIAPLVLMLLIIFVYQKLYVFPHYPGLSKIRINDANFSAIDFGLRVLVNEVYIFSIGWLSLAARGLVRLRQASLLTILDFVGLIAVAAALYLRRAQKQKTAKTFNAYYLLVVAIGIAGIHYLALSPPTIVGYLNRGLVSASFMIAVIAAWSWQKVSGNRLYILIWAGLFAAYMASFMVQRSNYIAANNVRNHIKTNVIQKIDAVHQDNMFILSDVPTYLPNNFNNETIFSDEVLDWANFLYVNDSNRTVDGISISPARLTRHEIVISKGSLQVLGKSVPLSNVWYYRIEANELVKVQNEAGMKQIFDEVVKKKPDKASADFTMREQLKSWLTI